jgi:diphosphomevalonate decarboxylase
MHTATAIANPNIAFIKYWGNCEADARIPANGSISMNLGGLETHSSVRFDSELEADHLILNGEVAQPGVLERVSNFMDLVRERSGCRHYAHIESRNNFPMGAGIASSASAFASLALAASAAAGLDLDEAELSRLARKGSGSACRSIPSGYVEWLADSCEPDSGAVSIAPPEHWDLRDCIAIVHKGHKPVSSAEGHALAYTSPLQSARVAGAPQRLEVCRNAILECDFEALARVVELDNHLMHAVMMTSSPRLLYWKPATLTIMQAVEAWREEGIAACYTIDAGPNVHVICEKDYREVVEARLRRIPGVQDMTVAHPGSGARLLEKAR